MIRLREIKWWFQRANGKKLPECDCWDFHITLAKTISDGLDYLLNGSTNWDYDDEHRKKYADLVEAKNYFDDYLCEPNKFTFVDEKRKKKAFKILGEYFEGLWD